MGALQGEGGKEYRKVSVENPKHLAKHRAKIQRNLWNLPCLVGFLRPKRRDNAHFSVLFGIFKIVYAHGVCKSVYLCSQTTQLFLVFFLLFRNLSIR